MKVFGENTHKLLEWKKTNQADHLLQQAVSWLYIEFHSEWIMVIDSNLFHKKIVTFDVKKITCKLGFILIKDFLLW